MVFDLDAEVGGAALLVGEAVPAAAVGFGLLVLLQKLLNQRRLVPLPVTRVTGHTSHRSHGSQVTRVTGGAGFGLRLAILR